MFEKAKSLRDRFSFTQDNGDSTGSTSAPSEVGYVQVFSIRKIGTITLFQVTNQVTQEGSYKKQIRCHLIGEWSATGSNRNSNVEA